MATRNNIITPARAVHPGEILREELCERGIKQKDFAKTIGVQASHLSEFIRGKRNLNSDLAIKLERHLGISFNIWMKLHYGYLYDCKLIDRAENTAAIRFESKNKMPVFVKKETSAHCLNGYQILYNDRSRVFATSLPSIKRNTYYKTT